MTNFGPLDSQVRTFVDGLAARNDEALWQLEEAVVETLRSVSSRFGETLPSRRPRPDTRPVAEASGRLLAWYEAGYHARLAAIPRDDGSVRVDVPWEATTVRLPHLVSLVQSIAQALVVRDHLTTNGFLESIAGWPEVIGGYRAGRLDGLTGLPRWQVGPESSSSDLHHPPDVVVRWLDPPPSDLVLVWIDTRGLKRVNDRLGLQAGDAWLRCVAERLSVVADPGVAFRIGGDEFLIAISLPDGAAIHAFAERLRAVAEQPIDGEPVGLWLGAARAGPGDDLAAIAAAADRARGEAEANGWTKGIVIAPADSPQDVGSSANSVEDTVERATEVLTEWARQAGFALSGGLGPIRLVPESVHGGSPGYGTRTGTWAEIEDFVAMWTRRGGSWVNIGWDFDERGRPILTYASQWRMGDPEEPRQDGRAPDINLHGPPTIRRPTSRPSTAHE